jgi:hypothetical protein
MAKTADYTIQAISDYQKRKDRIALLADKGTEDRIKAVTSKSINDYIMSLVYAQLEIDEQRQQETSATDQRKQSATDPPTKKQ